MKKLLSLIMAMVLASALFGCGSPDSSSSGGDSAGGSETASSAEGNTGETKKLTMILRAGSYTDVMKNMAPAFGEEHNVEFEYLDLDVANMYEKIALNSKSNQGSYDVLMIDEPWFREFQETGIISNLSELGCELDDDFIQEVTEICVDDNGDVYGVPFYGNVELMLYNVDVLSQYGYDAPPTSWTEVLDLAKKVKADGGKDGYLVRAQAGENVVIDIYPLLLAHGANILDENNQPTINTPEFKAALEFYIELKNAGQIMEKDDIVASVSNGDAAMSLTWPGWYLPEADEPIKFAPAPNKVGDGDEEHTSTSIYGIWYLGVASNSQNKELAMEYIDYITSPEIMTESVKFGGVPTRHSSYQDEEVQEARPHLASVYEAVQHAKFRPQLKEWPQITNAVGIELDNAIQNAKSVDQALADAQAAVERLLQG